MLSHEMNQRLSLVGPDTPGGNLMRRYWHPIAAASEFDQNPVKPVRILGEDLTLYRDLSGTFGLVAAKCPHRRASLEYGMPEAEGLRCAYHGWRFNAEGRCIEQPCEPWDSKFKENIRIKAYPVEELGGLVFAYLGPAPTPLLPRYDLLVWDNVVRHVGFTIVPCNWLQCVENTLDPVHVEWLHGNYMDYVYQRRGTPLGTRYRARHQRIGFDVFEHGIVKRRILEDQDETAETWTIGHPIVFPHLGRNQGSFQYRVPIDDTHTLFIIYQVYRTGLATTPEQEAVPAYEIPMKDEYGKYMTQHLIIQDYMAWASQGAIAEREEEHLGQSDIGVIMYRQMLEEQIDRVENGLEPTFEIYRDPAANVCIDLAEEIHPFNAMTVMPESERVQQLWQYEYFDPKLNEVVDYLQASERLAAAGKLIPPPVTAVPTPIGQVKHRQVVILPPKPELNAGVPELSKA